MQRSLVGSEMCIRDRTYGDLANGPYPSADTIFTEVYEEVPWHLQEQWDEMKKWSSD